MNFDFVNESMNVFVNTNTEICFNLERIRTSYVICLRVTSDSTFSVRDIFSQSFVLLFKQKLTLRYVTGTEIDR